MNTPQCRSEVETPQCRSEVETPQCRYEAETPQCRYEAELRAEKNQTILSTKQRRVDLDAVLQSVRQLPPSREVSLTITKIQEAIMWLRMNLEALDAPNPYLNSRDTTNTIIDKTADGLKL